MKQIFITIILFLGITLAVDAQVINWRSLQIEKKNSVYLNLGYDYGMTAQLGYGRFFDIFKPIVLTADYSMPMGEDLFDDAKFRCGGQIEVFEKNRFSVSLKLLGNARKYESDLVKIKNFGGEISVTSGYYKPTWRVAGEFGFDKSIVSLLEHKDLMKENYPDIKDGWYIPCGGNYFYGIQASKTFKKRFDISTRIGGTNAERNDENAMLPYYAQIGLIMRF